jgi:SSS family transporter
MAAISSLDLTIVVVYIVGTTLLGAWFGRKQRDVQTYFVGGRSVHWSLVLVSIVATETSTVTFLSVPGTAFNPNGGNLTFLQLAIGYIIGRVVIARFLLPQFLGGNLLSAYQVLRQRFSPTLQRLASSLFLITRTLADGLRLFLTALLLQQFTGWSMELSILVMGIVTLAYTYLGGMEAVIWTDLIQFVIYVLGALVAAGLIIHLLPGGWNEFVRVGSEHHKFELFDFSQPRTRAFSFFAGVIGGAVFTMASHGADQLMVQRYLCSRTLSHARLALVSSGLVVFVQFTLFLLIGVGLFTLVQSGILVVEPGTRNDAVFGQFIVTKMSRGLIGLVIAAVLAAAMSTLSSSLNSSAATVVSDFLRPWRPSWSDARYLKWSRLMTVGFGVLQMAVALVAVAMNPKQSVVELVLSIAGVTTGLVLGLFLLGSLLVRVSSTAAIAGFVVGAGSVAAVWIPGALGHVLLAWPWFAPLGAGSTVLTALAVNQLLRQNGPRQSGDRKP